MATIQFFGNVQGIGFRYTTCAVAKQFDVTEYVCNAIMGVELVVESTGREIRLFFDFTPG